MYRILEKKKTRIILESKNKKSYSLPKVMWYHLLECKNRAEQNLDALIIVTGKPGSGKSNGSVGLAGTWEDILYNRQFDLDKLHFLPDKVIERTNLENNETEAIDYDEAIQGATSKDGMTKIGFILRKALVTKRRKRHFYLVNVDNLKELSDKVIERAVAWYHFYYYRDKTGKYVKGLFKVFSSQEALKVYEDLKNKKYNAIEDHPIFVNKWRNYKTGKYLDIWFLESEYDKKKTRDTNLLNKTESSKNKEIVEQRNKLIMELLKTRTQADVGKMIGLSRSGISEIKSSMTPLDD